MGPILDNEASKPRREKGQDQLPVGQPLEPATDGWDRWNPWLTFLFPFVVYMVVGSFEPAAPKPAKTLSDGRTRAAVNENWFGLEYKHYPIVYTVKIALTAAAMLFVLPGYRQTPFRVSVLAIAVGIVGVILWIGICRMQLERTLLVPIGLEKFLGLGDARRSIRWASFPPHPLGPTRSCSSDFWASRSSCRSSKNSFSAVS